MKAKANKFSNGFMPPLFCTLLKVLIVSQKSNNNFIFTGALYS